MLRWLTAYQSRMPLNDDQKANLTARRDAIAFVASGFLRGVLQNGHCSSEAVIESCVLPFLYNIMPLLYQMRIDPSLGVRRKAIESCGLFLGQGFNTSMTGSQLNLKDPRIVSSIYRIIQGIYPKTEVMKLSDIKNFSPIDECDNDAKLGQMAHTLIKDIYQRFLDKILNQPFKMEPDRHPRMKMSDIKPYPPNPTLRTPRFVPIRQSDLDLLDIRRHREPMDAPQLSDQNVTMSLEDLRANESVIFRSIENELVQMSENGSSLDLQ